MAIRAVLVFLLALTARCAAKVAGMRADVAPPPEEPTIHIDDPETCCDDPCVSPVSTSKRSGLRCTNLPPDSSFKPSSFREPAQFRS